MNQNPLFPAKITQKVDLQKDNYFVVFDRVIQFIPGQALSLSLEEGGDERYYSIASPPGGALSILFNRVEEGQVSPQLAKKGVGDVLWLSPPFGTFYSHHRPLTMVATGTGIAPFISMIKAYQDLSDLILIHGARRKEDFLFSEIFMSCLGKNYHRCASQDQSEGLYPGRLTAFLEVEKLNLQSHFLLCGSPEMVVSSREILINRGIKHENILSEIYF